MTSARRQHLPEISACQQSILARERLAVRRPGGSGLLVWRRLLGPWGPSAIFGRQENLGSEAER